ncbi:MAG: hypothetical protein M0D53_08645 [Flavobacterium sp. JAD_PAG50586_2]|nr:MAG: hypothetical protein M0D53_08645 [Flavobacterium sp. JAD_PAG50586_2]
MTTNIKRHYNTKDVDMIITASVIIEAAIANKALLQAKRSTWADPFFENIKNRIDAATQDYLGVDNAKDLRLSTQIVLSMQNAALNDLSQVKVQIEQDYKNNPARKTEILTQLGFIPYYKGAQKKDQEALINLLYQFKVNLIPVLKTEIVNKGIAIETLDSIAAYADTLKEADIIQEGTKGTRRELTATAITEFNEIYDAITSIAIISAKLLKDNPALKQQFSYNKVSKTINAGKPYPDTNP